MPHSRIFMCTKDWMIVASAAFVTLGLMCFWGNLAGPTASIWISGAGVLGLGIACFVPAK